MSKSKGLVAAVLAYTAWGPLAPLGALLLADMGPFTLNTLRTAGTILLFTATMGPRVLVRTLRLLGHDPRLWLLGAVGLGFTFGAYLTSLLFLEPTIAALLIYFSPILVAWIAHTRLGERVPKLLVPAIALTILGSFLAVFEPGGGLALGSRLVTGLILGAFNVLGWTFYTVYLKHMGRTYGDQELTMSAFLTSGLVFLVAALAARIASPYLPQFETLATELPAFDAATFPWLKLAIYIVVPSFLSFQLYAIAVRHAGAALTATLLGIEVVATAIFSYFLTAERFGLEKVIGILIVLAAVTMFLVHEARRPLDLPAPSAPGQPQTQGDENQ